MKISDVIGIYQKCFSWVSSRLLSYYVLPRVWLVWAAWTVHLLINSSVEILINFSFYFRCAPIRYCEASMQNGFGLMYIYRFINIPFLHMQYTYLIQALASNRQAFSDVCQQLDLAEENQEPICSYEKCVSLSGIFIWNLQYIIFLFLCMKFLKFQWFSPFYENRVLAITK